ncbi:MAG TPA: hypothetical protein VNA25_05845 [Phycisphaerae bacterium]|nr:hypothetical protein [Phycisphaerae bacterium]
MSKSVRLSLKDIERRRDELKRAIDDARAELTELDAVERFYRRQRGEEPSPGKTVDTSHPSLTGAIRDAVRELGPIKSAQLIRAVHRVLPGAKASSIRSTSSVLRQKGEFARIDGAWVIAESSTSGAEKEAAASVH